MNKTNWIRLSPNLWTIISLAVFFGISLAIRVLPINEYVFVGEWIKFTTPDAYYFMRQTDSMVANFPHLIRFDPYLSYPTGATYPGPNLFVYLLSFFSWAFGAGSPTQHTVDVVSVYFPVIVAAMTVIPVYFIGKTLFNRWAGIIAAGLIAILPGEFLGRTILGGYR